MRKTVSIGGTDYPINLPFNLAVLEEAGDAIDQVNETQSEVAKLIEADGRVPTRLLAKLLRGVTEALWHAVKDAGSKVTLAQLQAKVTMGDLDVLSASLIDALGRSGMTAAGEPQPAVERPASPRKSRRSSRT